MHIARRHYRHIATGLVLLVVVGLILLQTGFFNTRQASFTTDPTADVFEAPHLGILEDEEVVSVPTNTGIEEVLPIQKVLYAYIEVMDGCGVHFEGECLNVRSGPGDDFPAIAQLRNHVVLKVAGKVERDGQTWIKLTFDEWLRYPERVSGDWYVSAQYVRVVLDEGDKVIGAADDGRSAKSIIVDRSEQRLYAYENEVLFMEIPISTGLELTPTPRGTFSIFKKTPSRYMQGPLPGISNQYYDLPGVPWNLYFTHDGAVIHGAYWHDSFGSPYSHGCVNVEPEQARELYKWAELGTTVTVRD